MSRPEILVRSGIERGLIVTVGISAVIHVAVLGALVFAQNGFLRDSRPLVSYTVDLVDGRAIGGTNLPPGPLAAKPAAFPPAAPAPAPAESAVKEPEPPSKTAEAGPEPRKAEPRPEKQEKQDAIALKKPESRRAEPKKKEALKPEKETAKEKQKVVSKLPAKASTPAVDPKKEAKPAASRPQTENKSAGARPDAGAEEARKIDAAIQAAVRRRAEALQKPGTGGGPISYGPGQGAGGGVIKGVEFILYYNDMISRIKARWAWAGTNSDLEAVVHFQIAPNGDIYNVRIARSSGDLSYDLSIERAVRAASPLSAPPEKYRESFSNVEITFRAQDLRS